MLASTVAKSPSRRALAGVAADAGLAPAPAEPSKLAVDTGGAALVFGTGAAAMRPLDGSDCEHNPPNKTPKPPQS